MLYRAKPKKISVKVAIFTPFKWDTLYVARPYAMKRDIVEQTGLDGSVLACSKIGFYDELTQLIFKLNGEIVNFFDISSYPLFWGEKKQYSIKDAQFFVSCADSCWKFPQAPDLKRSGYK